MDMTFRQYCFLLVSLMMMLINGTSYGKRDQYTSSPIKSTILAQSGMSPGPSASAQNSSTASK